MQVKPRLCACIVSIVAFSIMAVADRDHKNHGDRDDNDDRGKYSYSDHDRDEMHRWYHEHGDHDLPPGLAKKDRLPPGLEEQLVVRGTLPPGLRKRMRPCPEELERRLPPPPPECERTVIDGHLVLINRRTFMVLDIFHFEY